MQRGRTPRGAGLSEPLPRRVTPLFEFGDDLPELHRRLAYDLDRFWDENDQTMAKLFRAFRFAALGLAIEVLLLLASVSGTIF